MIDPGPPYIIFRSKDQLYPSLKIKNIVKTERTYNQLNHEIEKDRHYTYYWKYDAYREEIRVRCNFTKSIKAHYIVWTDDIERFLKRKYPWRGV